MAGREYQTILLTDDEPSIRNSLREILEMEAYRILEAGSGSEALTMLGQHRVDLMMLDIKMPDKDGMEVLRELNEQGLDVAVIMLTGHGTVDTAVEATQLGAFDFLQKPPDLNRLLVSVRNALDREKLVQENRYYRRNANGVTEFIGSSRPIREIKEKIYKVAPSEARVLISGESGTGKELVARWLHEYSNRFSGPFVDVNCAAIPSELFESELFGHEKGAFTGADRQRIGKFEQAGGGTLFLDEVGDMDLDAQSKVLRALQDNRITRVGGTESIPVDVRIIAATNKDLQQEMQQNRFREDLYHRLNVIPIRMPPLRERPSDIPVLAETFLERFASQDVTLTGKQFTREALDELSNHEWPGNVRELCNLVERAGVLSSGQQITANDVRELMEPALEGDGETEAGHAELFNQDLQLQQFRDRMEKRYILNHLRRNEWNISQTAKKLGIQRSHLYNKIKKYQIER